LDRASLPLCNTPSSPPGCYDADVVPLYVPLGSSFPNQLEILFVGYRGLCLCLLRISKLSFSLMPTYSPLPKEINVTPMSNFPPPHQAFPSLIPFCFFFLLSRPQARRPSTQNFFPPVPFSPPPRWMSAKDLFMSRPVPPFSLEMQGCTGFGWNCKCSSPFLHPCCFFSSKALQQRSFFFKSLNLPAPHNLLLWRPLFYFLHILAYLPFGERVNEVLY